MGRQLCLVVLLENLGEGHVVEVDVFLEAEQRLLAARHLGLQPLPLRASGGGRPRVRLVRGQGGRSCMVGRRRTDGRTVGRLGRGRGGSTGEDSCAGGGAGAWRRRRACPSSLPDATQVSWSFLTRSTCASSSTLNRSEKALTFAISASTNAMNSSSDGPGGFSTSSLVATCGQCLA